MDNTFKNKLNKEFKNNKSIGSNIKELVKKMRRKPNMTIEELNCSLDEYDFVKEVLASEKLVEDFKKSGNKYICARLRPGYIGNKVIFDNNTSYLQLERGKPYGTIVAISNKKGTATLGISYVSDEPQNHPYPIIGLARALKNAIIARDSGKEGIDNKFVIARAKSQVKYFNKRALAYFNPIVYSYSRGREDTKVKYDDYDEIHKRRARVLGKK